MDCTKIIEQFPGIYCVLSLRKNEAGEEYVAISAANKRYLASVGKENEEFVPNLPYTEYVAYDPNFEAMVRRCVTSKRVAHQYVNAELYRAWLDIYMVPMGCDEEGNQYCLFTYEMTPKVDSDKLVDISAQIAAMVLKTCIKLRENNDFRTAVKGVVSDIRIQCEAHGCSIILADFEEQKIDLLGVDYDLSFGPIEEDVFFKPEFYKIVATWPELISGSNCLVYSNERELEVLKTKAPAWYETLVFSKVYNIVLYPLIIDEKIIGFIFVTNFNNDKIVLIREIMELNAFILSAEVANYQMRLKLEEMSRKDLLTGVLNRNAMNNRISDFVTTLGDKNVNFGLIFVDVNGLKNVNDTEGHAAGDEMLKNVAKKIKSIFDRDDIYRAGGDEFLVFTQDITEKDFEEKAESLKELSNIPGEPSFAMGFFFDDNSMDIRKGLHIADSNMYKDKAEYYKKNPSLDRRVR